jgi:hypothetical protein
MTDGNNVTCNLTTWHGVSVLSMLTSKEVRTLILASCLQDGPIALCLADFNLGNANIDTISQDNPCKDPPPGIQADLRNYHHAVLMGGYNAHFFYSKNGGFS